MWKKKISNEIEKRAKCAKYEALKQEKKKEEAKTASNNQGIKEMLKEKKKESHDRIERQRGNEIYLKKVVLESGSGEYLLFEDFPLHRMGHMITIFSSYEFAKKFDNNKNLI